MAEESGRINDAAAFQARMSKLAQDVFRHDIKAIDSKSMQRPFKEDAPTKHTKVKQTVSAAALFKKKAKKTADKKHRSRRPKTAEPQAVTYFAGTTGSPASARY